MSENYKLHELLTIKNGRDYKHLNKGGCPVFGSGGLMTFVDDYLYEGESILLPRKGTLNNIMFVTGKFWTVDTMYWSIINTKLVNAYFLYNYLKNMNLSKIHTGSTLPSMTNSAYYSIPISLPEINIQKRIATVLLTIDNKIELNDKINAELEQMAKTLYDYWFVQFDFPDKNGNPYKSSGGKMVYNETLKREIPKDWKIGTFYDYILKDKGGDWGKEKQQEKYIQGVRCIRGADFPSLLGKGNCNAPTRYILEKNVHKKLMEGDLIIEISGGSPTQSTGRICYINNELLGRFNEDIITSNFCRAISLKNKTTIYNVYMNWVKLYDAGILFNFEGKTTGIKNFLFETFVKSYKLPLVPEELSTKFYNIVSNYFKKIQLNASENQKLAELRDWLLPMLMNGQIKVSSPQKAEIIKIEDLYKLRDQYYEEDRWVNPTRIAQYLGIIIHKNDLSDCDSGAKSHIRYDERKNSFEILAKDKNDYFSIGHELGHYLLHYTKLKKVKMAARKGLHSWTKKEEDEVQNFAGDLLMPEYIVSDLLKDKGITNKKTPISTQVISKIAKQLQLSKIAVKTRLSILGYQVK